MNKIFLYILSLCGIAVLGSIIGSSDIWQKVSTSSAYERWTVVFTSVCIIFTFVFWSRLRVVYLFKSSQSAAISMILVFTAGLFCIYYMGFVFYYIGGAGYEYGDRTIPIWVYYLWGTIPHVLASCALAALIAKTGSYFSRNIRG